MDRDPGEHALPGREAEMECLRQVWRRARRRRRQVVLLSGEPGVGKTALATRMAAEAAADGATVLTGRSHERPAAHYEPVAGALRAALGRAPTAFVDRGRRLSCLLPELGSSSASPAPPFSGQPGTEREELFDAVGDLVAELARPAPLVLVLDDLHWADRSAVLLLDRVVEATRESPLLVVACYCDTAVDRVHPLCLLLDALADDADVTPVRLQDLAPEALATVVPDPDLAAALSRRGEGNPLYVRELLHELGHGGHLRPDGALDPGADLDADLLPRSTDELLLRRISRLAPATRRLLAAAAVVGRPFDLDLVAASTGLKGERVRRAAADAVASGLLERVDADGAGYRFPHSVTRRTVYGRMPASARVRLHRRVGEALEAAGPEADDGCLLAEIAAHFAAASPVGRSEPAARYATAAGDRAMAVLAYETAADLYGRALALLDCSSPTSWVARCDLLLRLAEAQRQALEPARARQVLLEAMTAAETRHDRVTAARVRDALVQVGPTVDCGGPVIGRVAARTSDGDATAAAVALLRARHLRVWGPEDIDERVRAAGEVVRLAGDANPEMAAEGYRWRVVDLLELGRLGDADTDIAAHAALAETLHEPAVQLDAALFAAMRAMLAGRGDEARTASEAMARAGEAVGEERAAELHLRQRYWLDLEWGDEAEHTVLLRRCRRLAGGSDPAGAWRAAVALLLARAGHPAAARELARVGRHGLAARPHGPVWLAAVASVAEAAWLLADPRWTALLAPALDPFAGRLVVLDRGAACLGSVARLQGLLAGAAGRWTKAGRSFEEALEVHERVGALPLVARTSYEWGTTLLRHGRRGDVARAGRWLARAAELGAELGMRRLSDDARTQLKSA